MVTGTKIQHQHQPNRIMEQDQQQLYDLCRAKVDRFQIVSKSNRVYAIGSRGFFMLDQAFTKLLAVYQETTCFS